MTIIKYNDEEVLKALPPIDEEPTLSKVFLKCYQTAIALWDSRMADGKWKAGFLDEFLYYSYFKMDELYVVLMAAVVITFIRYLFTVLISVPLADYLQLTKLNQRKFPESLWKFVFYLASWAYCYHIVMEAGYNIVDEPSNCFKDFKRGMDVPTDFKILYLIQGSFYVHSFYATLFMDERRKDTWVMLLHHAVADSLLFFSYSVRYYKIAALVIFTHDITDICLEFAKVAHYLKFRGGKSYQFFDIVSSVFFLVFSFIWMVFRLYLYPIKVLYTAGHLAAYIIPDGPFYYSLNSLLWILFGMNIYWFGFISTSLIKIAFGLEKEIRDSREDEEEEIVDRKITKETRQISANHVESNSGTANHSDTKSTTAKNDVRRRH